MSTNRCNIEQWIEQCTAPEIKATEKCTHGEFRGCDFTEVPESIGNMTQLQTLDLR